MPAATTPIHDLPLLDVGQSLAELTVNEALLMIDAILDPNAEAISKRQITYQVINASVGGPKARHLITHGFTIKRIQVFALDPETIAFDLRMGPISELNTAPSPTSIVGASAPALAGARYANIDLTGYTIDIPDDRYIDLHVASGSGSATVIIEGAS